MEQVQEKRAVQRPIRAPVTKGHRSPPLASFLTYVFRLSLHILVDWTGRGPIARRMASPIRTMCVALDFSWATP